MEHEFDIKQGFDETTIMFCRKCGLSYRLTSYRGSISVNYAAWEPVLFQDHKRTDIDPPGPCRFDCLHAEPTRKLSETSEDDLKIIQQRIRDMKDQDTST